MLLSEGHQVRALDTLLYGGQSLLGLYYYDGFSFVHGDVRSADLVNSALDEIDAVVHLAAIVGDPACARQPLLAREVNFDASLQLFDLSQRKGVQKFILASTCSNYGRMNDSKNSLTEESELRPISLYAETKVAAERTLLDLSAPNSLALTILRFATLFGLSPRMRFDLTVNEFTMELLTRRKLVVYGEQFWRPYVHVRDAARAISLVLNAPREKVGGQVFNAGDSSQNYQKGQLVELICAQLGHDSEVNYVHKEEDPRDYRVSFEKIKRELAFDITRTVKEGVEEIIDVINQGIISHFDDPRYRN
jgi:nucleoside-diphosphate-sugar epimerase